MTDETLQKAPSKASLVFRSLHHRNFRLFFMGQGISLVGTWMQMVAGGWLAYDLTAGMPEGVRALWLGVVAFMGRIPTFVMAPLAGALVDRWNRRRVVIVTQVLAMVQAGLLAGLTLSHSITLWQLIVLSLMLGLINAMDIPARQSFMIEMLDDPSHLNNAIALNSSLVNGARIVGPGIAGVLLSATGPGFCFLLNAVSYIPVLAALFAMTVRQVTRKATSRRLLGSLADGFRYVSGTAPVRDALLLLALVSMSGASYPVLLPILAKNVLHHGSGLYSMLFATAGIGALFGAAFLAVQESPVRLGRWIATAPLIMGAGLVALGLSRNAWLSLAIMPVVGFGMIIQMASTNTALQTIVDDDMRGRLMSIYSMAFMGTVPFGSLIAGLAARLIGAPGTLLVGGGICIIGAMYFRPRMNKLNDLLSQALVQRG